MGGGGGRDPSVGGGGGRVGYSVDRTVEGSCPTLVKTFRFVTLAIGRFFGIHFVADGHFGYSSIHNSVNIIGRTFMLHLHGICHICVSTMCGQHFFVNNFNWLIYP